MSSTSGSESSQESGHESSKPPTRPTSPGQSGAPLSPRKRKRLESVDPSRVRKRYLEEKYNDGYRQLFNEDVSRAAARFETASHDSAHKAVQIGASIWSAQEKAAFFAALDRLGRDDIRGIAGAIGTKTIPETQQLLLLLHDAAAQQGHAKLKFRHIPAACEVSKDCTEQLDIAGEALAWYQESFEASQEHQKFGEHWLITPAVAEQIENALEPGRLQESRATSAAESEPEARRRGGKVVVGACTSCKKFKQKCDRKTPCSNCVRRKTQACEYPPSSIKSDIEPEAASKEDRDDPSTDSNMNILEAIPEANLLQPRVMLTLSQNIFMNRSPSIPSPWPHWSEYASDIAKEPSMYRSAFTDFHTLAVSVTKRLVQTAITQAISRVRSQIRRTKKGGAPVVRPRDVLAAIDILGMKRNGRERWRGVARRCALQVYDDKWMDDNRWSHLKRRRAYRDVPWDQVEQMLEPEKLSVEDLTTDAETSGNETSAFKSRAVRSGTPLPMANLTLSDSQDGSDVADNAYHASSDTDVFMHDEARASSVCSRDSTDRYTSVATTDGEIESETLTVEQFDQEASMREEQALWTMLQLSPPARAEHVASDSEESHADNEEKIITLPNDWRSWTDYHAEWEEFDTPVSPSAFSANQKPLPVPPVPQPEFSVDAKAPEIKPKYPPINELEILGARVYAAIQARVPEPVLSRESSSSSPEPAVRPRAPRPALAVEPSSSSPEPALQSIPPGPALAAEFSSSSPEPVLAIESSSSSSAGNLDADVGDGDDSSSIDVEMYRPMQSIEVPRPRISAASPELEEMDWDAFID